jgi:hypothetical protein
VLRYSSSRSSIIHQLIQHATRLALDTTTDCHPHPTINHHHHHHLDPQVNRKKTTFFTSCNPHLRILFAYHFSLSPIPFTPRDVIVQCPMHYYYHVPPTPHRRRRQCHHHFAVRYRCRNRLAMLAFHPRQRQRWLFPHCSIHYLSPHAPPHSHSLSLIGHRIHTYGCTMDAETGPGNLFVSLLFFYCACILHCYIMKQCLCRFRVSFFCTSQTVPNCQAPMVEGSKSVE